MRLAAPKTMQDVPPKGAFRTFGGQFGKGHNKGKCFRTKACHTAHSLRLLCCARIGCPARFRKQGAGALPWLSCALGLHLRSHTQPPCPAGSPQVRLRGQGHTPPCARALWSHHCPALADRSCHGKRGGRRPDPDSLKRAWCFRERGSPSPCKHRRRASLRKRHALAPAGSEAHARGRGLCGARRLARGPGALRFPLASSCSLRPLCARGNPFRGHAPAGHSSQPFLKARLPCPLPLFRWQAHPGGHSRGRPGFLENLP